MTAQFTAANPTLGYLYQSRHALLALMKRGIDDPDCMISIEKFDDVAFEKDGMPQELIQTKHHVNISANLSNSSVDLWKTIRVWSESILNNIVLPSHTLLTLVTTAIASPDSIAYKLRSKSMGCRDEDGALQTLREITDVSTNKVLKEAFDVFSSLTHAQQKALVNSMIVYDGSPSIVGIKSNITGQLRYMCRIEFIEAALERLEGWWLAQVIKHLSLGGQSPITHRELQEKINEIQDTFKDDNLPIDVTKKTDLTETDFGEEERLFIEQLKLIKVGKGKINMAMRDFYRSSEQRSRWLREFIIYRSHLEKYEDDLIEEWDRNFADMEDDLEETNDEGKICKEGKNLLRRIQDKQIYIRPRCTAPFIMIGSYYILSNRLRIGWHRDYNERLTLP